MNISFGKKLVTILFMGIVVLFSFILLLLGVSIAAWSVMITVPDSPTPQKPGTLSIDDYYLLLLVIDGGSLMQAVETISGATSTLSLEQALQHIKEKFPTVHAYFIENGSYVLNGVTVWPSSSLPAHTAIMTGAYPGKTGILGQRHFDREKKIYTSFIGLGYRRLIKELSHEVSTIFEYFPHKRSFSILEMANRGRTVFVPGQPIDESAIKNLRRTIKFFHASSKIKRRLGLKTTGIPRIMVVSLPSIDHESHNKYLTDGEIVTAYLKIDRLVAGVIDELKRAGIFERTVMVLTADHGMEQIDEHLTIDNVFLDMGFKVYRSWQFVLNPEWGAFEFNTLKNLNAANVLSLWGGNADALIYLKGQRWEHGRLIERWDIQPTEDDLHHYYVAGRRIDLPRRLVKHPAIGLVFTQKNSDTFMVYGDSGVSEIERKRVNGIAHYAYTIVEGDDPLRYDKNGKIKAFMDVRTFASEREWLNLTAEEKYPDAFHRIVNVFGSKRSPHIALNAADNWDFAPYFVSGFKLVGTHGSLDRRQSLVPILFSGPGVKKGNAMYAARTVDIVPTILDLFGVEYDRARVDGMSLNVGVE